MIRRYELSDDQFALIQDLLPANGRRGQQWYDHRAILNGLFWQLHTGAQGREVPERYGPWQTIYSRFRRWQRDGTIARILERLHLALNAEGRIAVDLWCIDATLIRGSRAAGGARRDAEENVPGEPAHHALGRSRGGFGTKLHLVVSHDGVPLGAALSPGEAHESQYVEPVLQCVRLRHPGPGRPRVRPDALVGDKGYSYPTIRRYLRRCGVRAVIPTRSNQRPQPRFDRARYRQRNIIERVVGWLKEHRRLATRFEKLAVTFHAMVTLAMIQRCLRLLDSSNRA